MEGVRQEENVLVDVTQGFNISIVYKALLQQSKSANIYDGRMVLTNARANMDQMHIKFEILTELCDDFKKCENCRYLPCIDRKVMIELRDLFYDIEKHYFNMLDIGESFLECLDKEQERKKLLETETKIQNNTEELIELYKNQGLTDNVYLSQQDLQSIKKQIKNLEKSKFVERFLELSLFYGLSSPLNSEMICIFPYFCPYAESAREIREFFI